MPSITAGTAPCVVNQATSTSSRSGNALKAFVSRIGFPQSSHSRTVAVISISLGETSGGDAADGRGCSDEPAQHRRLEWNSPEHAAFSRSSARVARREQFASNEAPTGRGARLGSAGSVNLRNGRYNPGGTKPACPRLIPGTGRRDELGRMKVRSTGATYPPATQRRDSGRGLRPSGLGRK